MRRWQQWFKDHSINETNRYLAFRMQFMRDLIVGNGIFHMDGKSYQVEIREVHPDPSKVKG